jgi:multidrug efflux pump subunit AcrA (membrane-fusion protein)
LQRYAQVDAMCERRYARFVGPVALALALTTGCERGGSSHDHGSSEHDHGHDHGHAHAPHAHAHEAEPEPIAITRWTDRYELFVELPPPAPGKAIAYHAHVTRLSDFAAVTEGTFHVRFKSAQGVAATEASQQGVKRPGIFVFESPAPAAGHYALEMSYEHKGQTDTFDCGPITVTKTPPSADETGSSAITFLKESQWKVPFATAWAALRPLAKQLELAAIVEPAASDQLTLGAPTGGRFFHAPKLALAEGLRVQKGDVIGSIVPTIGGDDFSRLQIAVDESRLAREQAEREILRVEPLVQKGLLPERRLVELRNELDTRSAQLSAATSRVGKVTAPGGAGGLTIKSTLDGVISQVLVPNGEAVEAGAALVRLGGTQHLWIRSRFVAKPSLDLLGAQPSSVRLASGEEVDLAELGARFVSAAPVVDPSSRVATWVVDVAAQEPSPSQQESSSLRAGASVVLSIRFGEPETLPSLGRPPTKHFLRNLAG